MIKLIRNELIKLKSLGLILCLIIVPIISIIFGSINYYMNTSILTKQWISLWTQVYVIYGLIFLPVLVGIVISFIWYTEHKNRAFILLLTSPVKQNKIIMAKIIVSFLVILITQVYFFVIYFIAGSIFAFTSPFPAKLFIYLIIATIFLLPLICLQCYVSIKIKSFVIPVGISLLISVLSLIAANQNIVKFIQKAFSNTQIVIAMNHYPNINFTFFDWANMTIFSIIIFIIFYFLQMYELKRKIK